MTTEFIHQHSDASRDPVILQRLSGDLLVIHPTPSDDWVSLAFQALPEEERPAHKGKIRILPADWDCIFPTLWIDPPERRMYVDYLGFVRDTEHGDEYVRGSVLLEEDGCPVYEEDFYYRYDPLGQQPNLLYRGKTVHFTRSWWHQEGDTIEIPSDTQPVSIEDFLPAEWSEFQEVWEEKIADLIEDPFRVREQYLDEEDQEEDLEEEEDLEDQE